MLLFCQASVGTTSVFSQSFSESKTSDQDELDLPHSFELGKSQEVVTDDLLRINLVKTEENHIDNVFSQSLQSSQENSQKREDNNNIIYSDCEKTLSIENDYEKEQKNKGDDSPPLRVKQIEVSIYDAGISEISLKSDDFVKQWLDQQQLNKKHTKDDIIYNFKLQCSLGFLAQESTL